MKGMDYHKSQAYDMLEVKTCIDDLHSYRDHLHQELPSRIAANTAAALEISLSGRISGLVGSKLLDRALYSPVLFHVRSKLYKNLKIDIICI